MEPSLEDQLQKKGCFSRKSGVKWPDAGHAKATVSSSHSCSQWLLRVPVAELASQPADGEGTAPSVKPIENMQLVKWPSQDGIWKCLSPKNAKIGSRRKCLTPTALIQPYWQLLTLHFNVSDHFRWSWKSFFQVIWGRCGERNILKLPRKEYGAPASQSTTHV